MEKNIINDVNDEINEVGSRIIGDLDTAAERIEKDVLLGHNIHVGDSDLMQARDKIKEGMHGTHAYEQDMNLSDIDVENYIRERAKSKMKQGTNLEMEEKRDERVVSDEESEEMPEELEKEEVEEESVTSKEDTSNEEVSEVVDEEEEASEEVDEEEEASEEIEEVDEEEEASEEIEEEEEASEEVDEEEEASAEIEEEEEEEEVSEEIEEVDEE